MRCYSMASPLYCILSVFSWCVGFSLCPASCSQYKFRSLRSSLAWGSRAGKLSCKSAAPLHLISVGLLHVFWDRLTVPPNTLAALSIWFTVWLSSRYDRRAPFIIAAAFIAIIGTGFAISGRSCAYVCYQVISSSSQLKLVCSSACCRAMMTDRIAAGAQYVGVHFGTVLSSMLYALTEAHALCLAAAGIYTGNALLLRYAAPSLYSHNVRPSP